MEFLQERKFSEEVNFILKYAQHGACDLYISYGSFYTITYLSEKYLKAEESLSKEDRVARLRMILNSILNTFKLASQSEQTIHNAVNDSAFSDLEDSYQAHIAEETGCDILLTINEGHFSLFAKESPIKVMTPQTFVDTYIHLK
jgi:predicted nucleic acid-binding protein